MKYILALLVLALLATVIYLAYIVPVKELTPTPTASSVPASLTPVPTPIPTPAYLPVTLTPFEYERQERR